MVGQKLKVLPTENTTYGDWKERYPNSLVLSEDTGYERDYSRNPYPDYHTSADIYFKVSNKNTEFHPKEMVLGLNVGDTYKAYPFSRLTKFHGDQLKDTIHGKPYIIEFDKKSQSARVYDSENNQVPGVTTFWFAWYAFHPNTEVFGSEE